MPPPLPILEGLGAAEEKPCCSRPDSKDRALEAVERVEVMEDTDE